MEKVKEMFAKAGEFVKEHKNVVIPVAVGVVGAVVGGVVAAVVLKNEDMFLEDFDHQAEMTLNIDGTVLPEETEEE